MPACPPLLKLGDKGRSARALRQALREQLVGKYLAPEECRAGCFLITLGKEKKWDHPDTGERIDLDGLIAMLNEDASRIIADMGGAVRIVARAMDLRPRLSPPEAHKS